MSSYIDQLIPKHIQKLNGYVAGKTIAEVEEIYNPPQISKLASNENRLGCSSRVKEAVLNSLTSIQDYPDPISRKLRRAISHKNGVSENQILLASGSESILSIICRTVLEKNDETVTADATFVGFFVQAGVMGAKLKKISVTDNYKFDVDGILNAVSDQTKIVYLANPNNPTGTYLNKTEFEKLVNNLPDHVLLIADEAYYEFTSGVEDYPSAIDYFRENMIILRTFSKAYGLAGFRIGYAIGDEALIIQMMKSKLTFEPTAPAQAAAFAAYEDNDFLNRSIELVRKGRNRLYEFFDQHQVKYTRSISNSVMMILDTEKQAVDFTQKMLENGVILRRINAFGLPNCVRTTIGTEVEMEHFRDSFIKVYKEILP